MTVLRRQPWCRAFRKRLPGWYQPNCCTPRHGRGGRERYSRSFAFGLQKHFWYSVYAVRDTNLNTVSTSHGNAHERKTGGAECVDCVLLARIPSRQNNGTVRWWEPFTCPIDAFHQQTRDRARSPQERWP
uniref:Uncharacterized protein n=1 Tax=Toxoplasma gondii (strain ATCC 50861 / VEG) TaxID=432359 RepID=A0A0F7UYK3_TOXGV|nr:TPA: hypothetical protein BN1205_044100 [Toxoplasma gondii VEG]